MKYEDAAVATLYYRTERELMSVSLRCSVELWPPGGDKPPESEYAAVIGRKYFTIKMGLDVFGGERCDLILASLSAPRSVGEQRRKRGHTNR